MFSFIINHCLKKPPPSDEDRVQESGEPTQQQPMTTSDVVAVGDGDEDKHGCCSGLIGTPPAAAADHHPKRRAATKTTTTTRISRSNFAKSTTAGLFPNTQFTNHESLPCLSDALTSFNQAYPQYKDTREADRIRHRHYPHLSDHLSLDYTGFTLFSHSQLPPTSSPAPFFSISYKPAGESAAAAGFESAMSGRIMGFLNVSPDDYTMACTANRTGAFRLLVDAYPFHSSRRLLTVYDYESEAVGAMQDRAINRGAKVVSAAFSWPNLRINSSKLKKALAGNKKSTKKRGLFVFPLQSRMSGTRYPYLWMRFAQENGWHVALDACALGPKELDTFGLSLIHPDFIVSSFHKVVGADPSGFACLLAKKSSGLLDPASSAGVVSIVPPTTTASDIDAEPSSSSASPMFEQGETSHTPSQPPPTIECLGLDHADSLGLLVIGSRLRFITNWLVIALLKLRHPNSETNGHPLVRIYGPRVKFERVPSVAFNVFDWKGERVEPVLVQKLADRFSISLSCGFLRNICFSDKYEGERDAVLERRSGSGAEDLGVAVVNASMGFLSNFEDAYKLWSFVARFLDADFVEKERWRYLALNQKLIEV